MTEKIQVTLEADILDALDMKRGRISRSAYARNILFKVLVEHKENQ